jgi:hypothetical protein
MENQYAYTNSIEIAAALVALGFPLREQEPVTRLIRADKSTSDTFYFLTTATSEDFGELSAMEVIREWRRPGVEFKQHHPAAAQVIDYMRAASENRREMLAAVKSHVIPRVAHEVNGRVLFLPLNASPDTIAAARKMVADVG